MKFLTIVGLLATAATFTADVAEGRELLQVSFWHRHGARDAPILVDGNINWNYAMLTQPGEVMAKNLGDFMRARYETIAPNFLPTDFPQFYEDERFYGSSGVDGRCVQTGYAVARGMMGLNYSYNVPYLFIPPVVTDYDLSFMDNYPNEQIRDYANKFLNNVSISQSIFSREEFNIIGQYLPDPTVCTSGKMDNYCASLGYDYAQCFLSNKGWSAAPGLEWVFPKLLKFQAISNRYWFGWNKADPYAPMGSPAYNDVKIALDNAASILDTNSRGAPRKVPIINQYSTHDNVIAGLMSTLGAVSFEAADIDITLWVPRFTATITAEVYDDGNIKFWWAIPEQAYGSGYQFTDYTPLRVSCINKGGMVYQSDECPLGDLQRFLATSAPQWDLIPKGAARECYLAPQDASTCNYLGLLGNATDAKCAYYRKYCPTNACNWTEGIMTDIANGYQCIVVPDITVEERKAFWDNMKVAAPAAAGSFVASLVLGAVLAYVMFGKKALNGEGREGSEYSEIPTEKNYGGAQNTAA